MTPTRLRDHGLVLGNLEPGLLNAITDVSGVRVGHVTVVRDEEPPPAGRGVARTGVTAILPGPLETLAGASVPAGVAVLNGAGELTGYLQVQEWGLLETPVLLTATMSVGRVLDGLVAAVCEADPRVGLDDVVIPVVGECDDSWLNEARVVQVQAADAGRAVASATGGPVEEGCVGAGTGMVAFGWKGGIGTASRRVPEADATVGVLVLANFGSPEDLLLAGIPVAGMLGERSGPETPSGSCIAVVATDAPLDGAQLERVARRAGLGLARTGSVAHDGSGEICLAFSTVPAAGQGGGMVSDRELDPFFAAAVEATEEAVLNAL